jgi:hypothetical protein
LVKIVKEAVAGRLVVAVEEREVVVEAVGEVGMEDEEAGDVAEVVVWAAARFEKREAVEVGMEVEDERQNRHLLGT